MTGLRAAWPGPQNPENPQDRPDPLPMRSETLRSRLTLLTVLRSQPVLGHQAGFPMHHAPSSSEPHDRAPETAPALRGLPQPVATAVQRSFSAVKRLTTNRTHRLAGAARPRLWFCGTLLVGVVGVAAFAIVNSGPSKTEEATVDELPLAFDDIEIRHKPNEEEFSEASSRSALPSSPAMPPLQTPSDDTSSRYATAAANFPAEISGPLLRSPENHPAAGGPNRLRDSERNGVPSWTTRNAEADPSDRGAWLTGTIEEEGNNSEIRRAVRSDDFVGSRQ